MPAHSSSAEGVFDGKKKVMRGLLHFVNLKFPFLILFLIDGESGLEVLFLFLSEYLRLLEARMIDLDLELFFLLSLRVAH